MKKARSIRRILLRSFLLLSAAFLGILTFSFTQFQYHNAKEAAAQEMMSACEAVAGNLKQTMEKMDTILLYSIASKDLKEDFAEYLSADTAYEKNRARQRLGSAMIALKGFDFSIRQMNLYDVSAGGYGVGNYSGDLTGPASELPWYEAVVGLAGKKYVHAPAADPALSRAAGVKEDRLYFSLCRMFYNDMHIPIGFIEVKQYYDEVFSQALVPVSEREAAVVVYDQDGRQIYPAGEAFSYLPHRSRTEVLNTLTGKKQVLSFSEDEKDGLTVVMAMDTSLFMAPVYRSLGWTLLLGFLLFGLSAVAAASLSRRLSDPVQQIYSFLSSPHEKFECIEEKETGIRELDKLTDSLNESILAQEAATRTMLTLKEQEVQAEMLALQSQMNPHFLYNSLSTIGEMADLGEIDQVSAMCQDITSILRYISSDREQRIRVEEEMEQVDRYLSCMKRRYQTDLTFSYRIEDEILDCLVPKLCVQLLVENAVKSVTTKRPPWEIVVEGGLRDEGEWAITVLDNGPGFDPEVDKKLRKNMDEILATGTLPSLKIEGMGILNIFIRLYLLDGILFVFDFGNRKEGGAFVTVGGHIRNED